MAKKPNAKNLNDLFANGENFTLTDAQYEKKTGAPLPKGKYYLINNSALAKKAKENGYTIEVIEKTVILTKNKERLKNG